ncbi:hypothetical protein HaLaN_08920, partial [Haematococcus lacustris]
MAEMEWAVGTLAAAFTANVSNVEQCPMSKAMASVAASLEAKFADFLSTRPRIILGRRVPGCCYLFFCNCTALSDNHRTHHTVSYRP